MALSPGLLPDVFDALDHISSSEKDMTISRATWRTDSLADTAHRRQSFQSLQTYVTQTRMTGQSVREWARERQLTRTARVQRLQKSQECTDAVNSPHDTCSTLRDPQRPSEVQKPSGESQCASQVLFHMMDKQGEGNVTEASFLAAIEKGLLLDAAQMEHSSPSGVKPLLSVHPAVCPASAHPPPSAALLL